LRVNKGTSKTSPAVVHLKN